MRTIAPMRRLGYSLYHGLWTFVDWLYPPICSGCKKPGERWCETCQGNCQLVSGTLCPICGFPQTKPGICRSCKNDPPVYSALRSWAFYQPPLSHAIQRLKYERDLTLGDSFALHLLGLFSSLDWPIDIITSMPLGPTRLRERGYNQVTMMAYPLALATQTRFSADIVHRVRETRSQVHLSIAERHENMIGAFAASPKVRDLSILVIDDVATTGATIKSCAKALLDSGAKSVYALTLARTPHFSEEVTSLSNASIKPNSIRRYS